MKNKGKLTSSKWLAMDTLSSVLKASLPMVDIKPNMEHREHWEKINRNRIDLWKLLQESLHIEHRIVEECSYEFFPLVSYEFNDVGLESRDVIFDVHLVPKIGTHSILPLNLFLKIKIKMFGDCGNWHVRKIIFMPSDNRQFFERNFFKLPVEFEIA